MKQKRVIFSFVVIAVTVLTCSVSAGPAAPPAADFMSASLVDQLHRGAIKITCDYTDSLGTAQLTYFRSETTQYLGATFLGQPAWFSRDLKQGITRQCMRAERSSEFTGTISDNSSGIATRFTYAMLPDPILLWIAGETLESSVARGTVASARDDLDGHSCWKVAIKPHESCAYSAWLDPEIAFLPRKVVVTQSRSPETTLTSTITYADYKMISGELWLPMKTVKTVVVDGALHTTSISVVSAEIVVAEDLAALNTSFPSGTKVTDYVLDAEYTVP